MNLDELRKEIDDIDLALLALFKKRMIISKQIGDFKRINQLPILDKHREETLMKERKQQCNDEVLWPYYERFLKMIMALSKDIQHD